ncbi:MAG: SDR family oxidoreductase, partial [Alphaproteobacteria bacterium]|nr:SDR family oxidoreductase [Alphaproteobacteria bacterium]
MADKEMALIVGVGEGLSASLARTFKDDGIDVALAARNPDKLGDLVQETGAMAYACDASDEASVNILFADLARDAGTPDLVVYNPSYRTRGPFVELDPGEVEKALAVTCFGAFLVGQAAA